MIVGTRRPVFKGDFDGPVVDRLQLTMRRSGGVVQDGVDEEGRVQEEEE